MVPITAITIQIEYAISIRGVFNECEKKSTGESQKSIENNGDKLRKAFSIFQTDDPTDFHYSGKN